MPEELHGIGNQLSELPQLHICLQPGNNGGILYAEYVLKWTRASALERLEFPDRTSVLVRTRAASSAQHGF